MNSQNKDINSNDSVESVVLKNQTPTIDEVKEWQNMRKIAEEFWLKDIKEPAQDGSPILNPDDNQVNHPPHYNTNCPTMIVKCECGKTIMVPVECIDVIRDMPSWKGNAIKYLWREGLKPDSSLSHKEKTIQDLKKAVWYINDKIKELEKL